MANNRWIFSFLLIVSLVFLIVVLANLNGKIPVAPNLARRPGPNLTALPVHKAEQLFDATNYHGLGLASNLAHPFYTTYFQPPPAPKPSAVQKVDVLYQGFYKTASGQLQAFVKIGEALNVAAPGDSLLGEYRVAEIHLRQLILTNAESKKILFEFNRPQSWEVPKP